MKELKKEDQAANPEEDQAANPEEDQAEDD